jgi:hypothetical protein
MALAKRENGRLPSDGREFNCERRRVLVAGEGASKDGHFAPVFMSRLKLRPTRL